MAKITFNRFDLGIDLRKGASVSDANRLRDMKNAYVTTGLATEKRPGTSLVATLETGTKGLVSALGKLNTFYAGASTITHANTLFQSHKASGAGITDVDKVEYADVFNGFIYAALRNAAGTLKHHYFDANPTSLVVDVNCPNTAAVIKLASKIFAVGTDGSTVRYCKTNDPRDWTTVSDAGFLPTGLNATGDRTTNALGQYQKKMVALARDGAQVWTVDPDPANMSFDESVENVGTSYPRSLATVGGDLFFLSDFGFRSITTSKLLDKKEDVDVGSPIDPLAKAALAALAGTPRSIYYYGSGQYICAIDEELFVYSISRTSKIAAWSRYLLPFTVDAVAELQGVLYLRSGDNVYQFSEDVYADNGVNFEVLLELPYMDFKLPGNLKSIYGFDIVQEGECYFSMGWDARYPTAITDEVRVVGSTRGGGMTPLEVTGTEFSPRFRNTTNEAFRLEALTIYYNDLGPV